MNQRNLVSKTGKPIYYSFTEHHFCVFTNPNYNKYIDSDFQDLGMIASIPIESNRTLINYILNGINYESFSNTEEISDYIKSLWNGKRRNYSSFADVTEKQKGYDRNGEIYSGQLSNRGRKDNGESSGNISKSTKRTPNRGINTDEQRLSLKKSLQEQYHDQLADAAKRIAERQAKVLSDSKKGIKARAADYLDRAEYNWADRRFYLRFYNGQNLAHRQA